MTDFSPTWGQDPLFYFIPSEGDEGLTVLFRHCHANWLSYRARMLRLAPAYLAVPVGTFPPLATGFTMLPPVVIDLVLYCIVVLYVII